MSDDVITPNGGDEQNPQKWKTPEIQLLRMTQFLGGLHYLGYLYYIIILHSMSLMDGNISEVQ